jgi:hypothetical protein
VHISFPTSSFEIVRSLLRNPLRSSYTRLFSGDKVLADNYSKLVPTIFECLPRLFSDPPSDLIAYIARILEVDTAEDPTISIVFHCLLDACSPPRDDLLDAGHVTAQLNIDFVAAVPQADHCAGCRAERSVCAQVVLMVRCRIEERGPAWIRETRVGGEVDRGIVVERSDRPPAAVEILGVPGSNCSVRQGVVQDSVEASGSGDVLCQAIANY